MADRVEITIIVDNYIDIFLPSTGVASYPVPGPGSRLLGEQGLSLWLNVWNGRKVTSLLYDFGRSSPTFFHNLELLGLDIAQLDYLVVSHGHRDHFGALKSVLKKTTGACTLIVHPEAVGKKKYVRLKDGSYVGPWEIPPGIIAAWSGNAVLNRDAHRIADDMVVSGRIERRTDFEPEMAAACVKEGARIVHDAIPEDQALFIDIEGKGLLVVTGCCHAGLVNTVMKGLELFPGKNVYAVAGGLHLNSAGERQMDATIDYLSRLEISYIAPLHCTGYHASMQLMNSFKERGICGTVGAKLGF
jgi:7,8-dihydropterin-6-yl-methyl-4-(beta-D-ribofuranosyl)aminobenzene 5'-phosphate synthase